MTQTFKLEGDSLKAAQEIREIDQQFMKTMEELKAAAERTARELRESNEERRKALWDQICAACGVENDRPWTLDAQYWEGHGIIFMKSDEDNDGPSMEVEGGMIPVGGGAAKALLAALTGR